MRWDADRLDLGPCGHQACTSQALYGVCKVGGCIGGGLREVSGGRLLGGGEAGVRCLNSVSGRFAENAVKEV